MSAFDIIQRVQHEASGLPAEERLRVARALINAGEALAASVQRDDDDAGPELEAAIRRRLASIRDGSAELLSKDQFTARVRSKLAGP
jgi:hypothetical protein